MRIEKSILGVILSNQYRFCETEFTKTTPTFIDLSDKRLFLTVIDSEKSLGYFYTKKSIKKLIKKFLRVAVGRLKDKEPDDFKIDLLSSQFIFWLSLNISEDVENCIPMPVNILEKV